MKLIIFKVTTTECFFFISVILSCISVSGYFLFYYRLLNLLQLIDNEHKSGLILRFIAHIQYFKQVQIHFLIRYSNQ